VAADPVLNIHGEMDYAGAGLNSAECLPLGDVVASFAHISVPAFLSGYPIRLSEPIRFLSGDQPSADARHLQEEHVS
jgi:hypothetical protein